MTTTQLVKGDITTMLVDAIVNAANRDLRKGGGVCGAIFAAAGADKLQKACDEAIRLHYPDTGFCPTGQAIVTSSFDLEERGITFLSDAGERPLTFTLVESDAIARLQRAVAVIDGVARALPWIVITMYAAAVYLAPDRRRAVARAGTGVIAGSLALLLTIAAARGAYLGALPTGASPAANEAIFDTLSRFLRGGGRTVLAIGLVMVGAAVAAGPGRGAQRLRRTTSQWLDRAGRQAGSHGMDLGPTGTFVSSNVRALRFTVTMLGVLVLVSVDRPSGGTVLWIAVGTVLVLLAVDLIARTARPEDDATPDTERSEPTLQT